MHAADATRLAGDPYSTRLARGVAAMPDERAGLTQQGYQSILARDTLDVQPDAGEFYKSGDKIGDRYEVLARHHGAMGVVYGCFDHVTRLPRALKTVRAQYAKDKQVLSMFEAEATVWISLEKHPYIVRAYLVERFKDLPYVITEYVRGPEGMEGDLRGWLGHPRLTLSVAVAMALQIAQGMQHAVHKVPNLVHRDLKPANILVNGDGKAMVTDFGLVQSAQSDAGTPAYMSPEQWRGDALDARSDIYAYGCILFEMFTAHRLFPALTEPEWEHAHHESMPVSLTSLVPGLPREIDIFVVRCLAKEPATRLQNWDEIVTFFAEWYHRLTGKAVVFDFSSLALNAAEWVAASYSLWQLKRYEEAIQACDQALLIDPNMASAWANKGLTFTDLKRYAEALQACDRAIAIDPDAVQAWNSKGIALSSLKRNAEALQSFNGAILIDPSLAVVWSNRGRELIILKRFEEAIQAYDRALAIDPSDSDTWIDKGLALSSLKRGAEAIKAYDQALVINPSECAAWNSKGATLIDLNHNEEAVKACDKALAIDPNHSKAWLNKGLALKNLHRYEGAIQAYDRALAIDPNNYAVWSNKGLALNGLNRNDEAIKAYDQALAIDPNRSEAWYNKGLALIKIQHYEEAILAYDQVLAIDQNDSTACYSKGCALHHLNRIEEAIRAYDRALSIYPNNYDGWCNKGLALNGLNRNDEAVEAYDHALAIDPNRSDAWVNKGYALNDVKRYEEAIQSFDKVLAIDPKNAYASSGKAHASAQTPVIDWSCVDSQNAKNIVTNKLEQHAITPKEHQPRSFWGRLFGK